MDFQYYRKFPEYLDTKKICCNHSKIWTMWLCHRVMSPNNADRMANSVDPVQTAPSGAVWSGSALIALACLSENLGSLRYFILVSRRTRWPVRPMKTQISLGIRPVWSESSLSAWRRFGSWVTHKALSKDSDQTEWMPMLIWVFTGCTGHFVWFCCAPADLSLVKWAASWQNQQNGMCDQRRHRSAWASAQSDQSLRCPHEESLGP